MSTSSRARFCRSAVALLLLAAVLPGCSTETVDDTPTNATANSDSDPSKAAPEAQQSESSPENTPEESVEKEEAALSYEPPFPERLDLFIPPKRDRQSARAQDQPGNVQLIGFASVENRQVVLSVIDGEVHPIAEGEVCCGVEVLSIKQPAVVLQRGREKWQVTLRN